MTPNELRALAEALEPIAAAPRFEDFDVPAFCAWVRAQAEAEPVAWIVEHGPTRRLTFFDEAPGKVGTGVSIPLYTHPAPAVPAGWKLVPVEPTPEMLSAVGMMDGYDWHAPGCSPDADHANWYSAMIAAAPAAPQAEPIDPHMIVAEDRFPDVPAERWKPCPQCGEDVDRECPICDGLGRVLATDGEQAEPKREPLSDEQIDMAQWKLGNLLFDDFGHDLPVRDLKRIAAEVLRSALAAKDE